MIVAGCDVGSLTAKAVIMDDGAVLSSHVMPVRSNPSLSADEVMGIALSKSNLSMKDLEYAVGTGYGRKQISFVNQVESEITCHGKAVNWLFPTVRMIIDIGGQDAKAIRVDRQGNIVRYAYNDRCATGTGRFLEIMADALDVRLEDMGELSSKATNPANISNQCTVFAESEVVSLVNDGREIPDIISGLHRSMAHRVAALLQSVELEADLAMSGGVAKNIGMFSALEQVLGIRIIRSDSDPQINGALGAALIAREAVGKAA
jgi:predicted CoA-substrate-specific enzyme activase